MGQILRSTVDRSRKDPAFADLLESRHALSRTSSIFDCLDTTDELSEKVRRHLPDLEKFLGRQPSRFISEEMSGTVFVSPLDWLEYCTARGLLIPDRWTQELIAAEIDAALTSDDEARGQPFILDGYPRTVGAARHLLSFLRSVDVPVLKVLHLSISTAEMRQRAGRRGRFEDDEEALHTRFGFDVEAVQPSIDSLKSELGSDRVARIEAHPPIDLERDGDTVLDPDRSIEKVVSTALRALGVPRVVVRDLLEHRRERLEEVSP
jgi:adenylate kinase family enzyme